MWFLAFFIFARLFWQAREMLVKHPPAHNDSLPNSRPIDYTSATTLPSGATFTYINLNPSMDK